MRRADDPVAVPSSITSHGHPNRSFAFEGSIDHTWRAERYSEVMESPSHRGNAMARRNGLILVTAGAIAIAAVSPSAFAGAARDRSAVTTELSAQSSQDQKNKK